MSEQKRFNYTNPLESAFLCLDEISDSFEKCSDIKTDLLYGILESQPMPTISVILPTYQRGQSFREALESIVNQNAEGIHWECLVMDNTPLDTHGSTPALEIVRSIDNPHVLYYHNRVNIGSGYNWNRGVELAHGEWVCFLHDDDVLLPNALKGITSVIQRQNDGKKPLGIIQARRVKFSRTSELKNREPKGVFYIEPLTRTRSLIRGDTGMGAPSCGTTFLKRAYIECGGINYDYGLVADAVLGYQIMRHYRVICSNQVLGAYRWAENETLKKTSLQKLIQADYLFACYRYNQSLFSQLWGGIFWRAEYNENIRYKIRDGKKGNVILTPKDFNEILPYRRTNLLIFFLYKVIQRLYTFFSIILYPLTYGVV